MDYKTIFKWDARTNNTCSKCYFQGCGENYGERLCDVKCEFEGSGLRNGHWHYVNKEQAETFLEEAEKGYEWSKENCLWVCKGAMKCDDIDCWAYKPHKHTYLDNPIDGEHCVSLPGGDVSSTPYRGEPKPGDTMEINGITHVYSEGSTGPDNGGDVIMPKEDDMKSEVPSNARGLEYRVKKCFAAYTLSSTDINPEEFKLYYMLFRGSKFEEGENFTIDPQTDGPTHDIMLELLRLGFVEPVDTIENEAVSFIDETIKHLELLRDKFSKS